jgi:hypothetical protein
MSGDQFQDAYLSQGRLSKRHSLRVLQIGAHINDFGRILFSGFLLNASTNCAAYSSVEIERKKGLIAIELDRS